MNSDTFYATASVVGVNGEIENKNYNEGEYDLVLVINNEDLLGEPAVLYDIELEEYLRGPNFYFSTKEGKVKSPLFMLRSQGQFSVNIEGRYRNPELVPEWLDNLNITGQIDSVYLDTSLNRTGIFRPVLFSARLLSLGLLYFETTTIAFIDETGAEIGSCTSFEGTCDIEYIPDLTGNLSIYALANGIYSNSVGLLVEKWILIPVNERLVRSI